MKRVEISCVDALVPHDEQKRLLRVAESELALLGRVAHDADYRNDRSSIHLPFDHALEKEVRSLVQDTDLLIVVGIGGSNLGTMAIHHAVQGMQHNGFAKPTVLFADTVDTRLLSDFCAYLDRYRAERLRVMINVISKSGTTTETIANAALLLQHAPDARIVVTTDEGSALWDLAGKQGYARLRIPKTVGGRYSVLTAVGQFPLAVMGIDVHSLLQGAAAMRERCLASSLDNPALQLAIAHYYHAARGKNISDSFFFSSYLESLGKWGRQLLAESVGKELDLHGKKVHTGITPTISIGSTDLHSIGQLVLGGPADKFTTFVTVEHETTLVVPEHALTTLIPHIAGKNLHALMHAISDGTMQAYREANLPFARVTIPSQNAYCIGQYLQLQMMSVMILASFFGVNAFDQPAVEKYKKHALAILNGPLR